MGVKKYCRSIGKLNISSMSTSSYPTNVGGVSTPSQRVLEEAGFLLPVPLLFLSSLKFPFNL